MKKVLISLAILLLGSISCFAQEEDTVSNKNIIWGIKANLSAELPTKLVHAGNTLPNRFNSGFGASIGVLANIDLGKNFYFEPEVGLFYEEYSYDNVRPVGENSPSVNVGPTIHKLGVRIPLNVGYFINISEQWGLDVYTGPQLSLAFYGDAKSSGKEYLQTKELEKVFSGKYAQNRFDVGWKIGVGFPVDQFLISLEGDIGITNMMKNVMSMHENRLSLGITYYF